MPSSAGAQCAPYSSSKPYSINPTCHGVNNFTAVRLRPSRRTYHDSEETAERQLQQPFRSPRFLSTQGTLGNQVAERSTDNLTQGSANEAGEEYIANLCFVKVIAAGCAEIQCEARRIRDFGHDRNGNPEAGQQNGRIREHYVRPGESLGPRLPGWVCRGAESEPAGQCFLLLGRLLSGDFFLVNRLGDFAGLAWWYTSYKGWVSAHRKITVTRIPRHK
jgi:hypothetical protein